MELLWYHKSPLASILAVLGSIIIAFMAFWFFWGPYGILVVPQMPLWYPYGTLMAPLWYPYGTLMVPLWYPHAIIMAFFAFFRFCRS